MILIINVTIRIKKAHLLGGSSIYLKTLLNIII